MLKSGLDFMFYFCLSSKTIKKEQEKYLKYY
ncbi:unknown [Bacteroides clarus CAG:160]|nr:unknown [Bacteroides clarus CAG:160]